MTRTDPLSPTEPLSPTDRTTLRRATEKAATERGVLLDILREGLVAHVAYPMPSHPVVLPMAYAYDPQGPDHGGTLYLHGSVAAGMMTHGEGATLCAAVTLLDGLVLARSGFHHSMNYRCAVIIGSARLVTDQTERANALDGFVDQIVPGRSGAIRPSTRKELAATAVLAIPLYEASVKQRSGAPVDEPSDAATGAWAGHIPLGISVGGAVSDEFSRQPIPDHILRRVEELRA
ncbi:MAG: pyridoxamine 5'-phosphate oxidase family protein [Ornithinimicrobium sp.]